jgi:hypothetical protein
LQSHTTYQQETMSTGRSRGKAVFKRVIKLVTDGERGRKTHVYHNGQGNHVDSFDRLWMESIAGVENK